MDASLARKVGGPLPLALHLLAGLIASCSTNLSCSMAGAVGSRSEIRSGAYELPGHYVRAQQFQRSLTHTLQHPHYDQQGRLPPIISSSHRTGSRLDAGFFLLLLLLLLQNDEYMVKFVYENELYRILCSCEMNASQIKATMIQHVKSQTELNELKEEIAKEEARVAFQGTEQAKEAGAFGVDGMFVPSDLPHWSHTWALPSIASTVEKNKQSLDEKDYLLKIPGVRRRRRRRRGKLNSA